MSGSLKTDETKRETLQNLLEELDTLGGVLEDKVKSQSRVMFLLGLTYAIYAKNDYKQEDTKREVRDFIKEEIQKESTLIKRSAMKRLRESEEEAEVSYLVYRLFRCEDILNALYGIENFCWPKFENNKYQEQALQLLREALSELKVEFEPDDDDSRREE